MNRAVELLPKGKAVADQIQTSNPPLIIAHRVNTIEKLRAVPKGFGVEIDVRGCGNDLLLNHEPITKPPAEYVNLAHYLAECGDRFVIFNMKEAGYEEMVIEMAAKHGISDYFLLDVEFPYLYRATRKDGFRKIAVRFSEAEPIEAVEAQIKNGKTLLDWVWIDTNTMLPLDTNIIERLRPFKTCLVCPDRRGRSNDIVVYAAMMKALGFTPSAVMTDVKYLTTWTDLFR